MRKQITSFLYKTLLLISVLALILGCSRKKDKWVNRNFHAMGTYYNILFHGDQALDLGQRQIAQNYVDDYWDILPLERMKKTDDSVVYGEMVESSEFKMPDRSAFARSRKKRKQNAASKSSKKSGKNLKNDKKSASDAFSNFNNNNANLNNQNNRDRQGNQRNGNSNRGFNNGNRNGQTGNNRMNNNPRGNQNTNFQNQNNSNPTTPNRNGGQFNNNSSVSGRNNQSGRSNNAFGGGNRNGRQSGNRQRGGMAQNNSGRMMGGNSGGRNSNANGFSNNLRSSVSGNQLNRGGSNNRGASGRGQKNTAMSSDDAFDRAEEKATKAIQKHNMLINGEEHNPQMKDAFLLLGKARYFDQRYFPALEAFNYIIHKYEDRAYVVTAQIWREKTYMRLENYDRAIDNLTSLLNHPEELSGEDIVEASTALAQAYLNSDEDEKAIRPLNMAIKATDDNAKKGRYLFVKGQIFESLKQIDSANAAFDKVIALNRKSPRVYMVHSYMEKVKNFDFKTGDRAAQLDTLKLWLADRENRPFLDVINYQTAQYYKDVDSMKTAIGYYNKALRTGTSDHGLRFRTYKTLGNYYFDAAQYKKAGAYYDSTMVNLPEDSREYRTFRRKRINLDGVIFYEDVARKNDSILHLVHMSPEKRQAYFKRYTDSLKTAAIAQAEKAEKDANRSKQVGNMFGRRRSQAGGGSSGFYFYNPQLVESGKQTFKQIWGDRDLQDNWRTEKSHSSHKKDKEETKKDFMAAIENNPNYKVQTYLDQLPKDEEVIDSLSDARNFAYYQLGIIYNEKFSEYQLAADKLEKLLKNDPEERLILPSKYNLYKIYKKLNEPSKAEKWKQDILANHSDSRYAKILRNPRSLRDEKTSPEKVYYKLYKQYKAGDYQEVIDRCDEGITRFNGEAIVPKMELLKAMATGRLYGLKSYKKALNYVALNYPQTEEGKKAEEIVNKTLPKLEKEHFVKKAEGNYSLVYPISASDKEAAEKLQKRLNKAIEEFEFKGFHTSIDIYSPGKIFVIVRGLHSKMGAEGLGEKLEKEKHYKIKRDHFGISSVNYEILLRHKNLNQYRQKFEKND